MAGLGEWRRAAKAWTRALALTPTDAEAYGQAASTLTRGSRPADALPLYAHAARLDARNWQQHYSYGRAALALAFAPTPPLSPLAAEALTALRPLHRAPISLRMRAYERAEPPWQREGGRGLIGDQPAPLAAAALWARQAARRAAAGRAGRQSGVIVYKLGPKASEVENLRLSLTLLTRYHNRVYRYPIVVAHDEPLAAAVRVELRNLTGGAPLSFVRLRLRLPVGMARSAVPEQVLGFPVAYRHMIRWKVGLMWEMGELRSYEYIWLLDTDAFLLGPLTYDVFGAMADANATYGYIDVNVETPQVADGLASCVGRFLRARPSLKPTTLGRFAGRQGAPWDGSKFYTNFQVLDLG